MAADIKNAHKKSGGAALRRTKPGTIFSYGSTLSNVIKGNVRSVANNLKREREKRVRLF